MAETLLTHNANVNAADKVSHPSHPQHCYRDHTQGMIRAFTEGVCCAALCCDGWLLGWEHPTARGSNQWTQCHGTTVAQPQRRHLCHHRLGKCPHHRTPSLAPTTPPTHTRASQNFQPRSRDNLRRSTLPLFVSNGHLGFRRTLFSVISLLLLMVSFVFILLSSQYEMHNTGLLVHVLQNWLLSYSQTRFLVSFKFELSNFVGKRTTIFLRFLFFFFILLTLLPKTVAWKHTQLLSFLRSSLFLRPL